MNNFWFYLVAIVAGFSVLFTLIYARRSKQFDEKYGEVLATIKVSKAQRIKTILSSTLSLIIYVIGVFFGNINQLSSLIFVLLLGTIGFMMIPIIYDYKSDLEIREKGVSYSLNNVCYNDLKAISIENGDIYFVYANGHKVKRMVDDPLDGLKRIPKIQLDRLFTITPKETME